MKRIRFLCALFVMVLFVGTEVAGAADATNKLKVLVITGGHGFKKEPFFQMFADDPGITFTNVAHVRTSASAYDRDDLLSYDVVVLYDMVQVMTDHQRKAFLSLFDAGVGLVVMHHALVSYQDWPEYERIIGGIYPENQTQKGVSTPEVGYQHGVDIPVVVAATNHPATAGLKDFTVNDEIYWGFRVGKDVTPLLTTTQPKSGKPLAWCRTEKKSRVVFVQLGHGTSIFEDPNYRKFLAQSIRWAAHKPMGVDVAK